MVSFCCPKFLLIFSQNGVILSAFSDIKSMSDSVFQTNGGRAAFTNFVASPREATF